MTSMSILRLANIALMATLSLCGCNGAVNSSQATLTFAFIPRRSADPVAGMMRDGAASAALVLTQGGQKMITIAEPATDGGADQPASIEAIGDVNGLIVSVGSATTAAAIDQTVNRGIPVVTVDSDIASRRRAFVGVDPTLAGAEAATLLASHVSDQGQVAVLTADNQPLLAARLKGFTAELQQHHPNVTIAVVVSCSEQPTDCAQAVEATQRAQSGLRGWLFLASWPLLADPGSMPTWEQAARAGAIRTVSFDVITPTLRALQSGLIQSVVGANPWLLGYQAVQTLLADVAGGAAPPSAPALIIGCQANAATLLAAWSSVNFDTTVAACDPMATP